MSTLLEPIRALPVDEPVTLAVDALESNEGNGSPDFAPSLQDVLKRRVDEHLTHPGRAVTREVVQQRMNEIVENLLKIRPV